MEVVVAVGAGLDVHKKRIVACCIDGRSSPPQIVTCTFGTYRDELERMRDWLLKRGCTHVAMESTGVYWLPVYRVLEGTLQIVLGNARHMANVPGRKTDVSDAQWIAQLLRHGLIKANFVPPRQLRDLRQVTRYRRKLVQTRSSCQLRVEKLLQSSNIKLSSVASSIFGVSGQRILQALADGKTNPVELADLVRGTLRNKRVELSRALAGLFTAEHAQLLKVELQLIDDIETRIASLEQLIDQQVTPFAEAIARLDTIPGVDRTLAIDLLAEIGIDMSAWPSDRHFVAWTGTCPGNRESAGIRRPSPVRDGNPYVKSLLIQAAVCASRTVTSHLAARYRRLSARRGPRRAAVAVAREIAVAVYFMLARQKDYVPPTAVDPQIAQRRRANQLLRELAKLGYEVPPIVVNR